MKRRWRLWLGLALLLLVGIALSFPAVHWRLIGWPRGEAFFQGRPTMYWARELRKTYDYYNYARQVFHSSGYSQPSRLSDFLQLLWDEPAFDGNLREMDLVSAEDSIPVLIELTDDDDEVIRELAWLIIRHGHQQAEPGSILENFRLTYWERRR